MPKPIEANFAIDQLVEAVVKSPKYKSISRDLIYRIGSQEIEKRKNLKFAIKETKNKLHQVGGSFFQPKLDYNTLLTTFIESKSDDDEAIKNACRKILTNHQSTSERLKILDNFYRDIFQYLPKITSILDLACGLNPLTAPWLPDYPDIDYRAIDIYSDLINFLNLVFQHLGIHGNAKCEDILSISDFEPVDMVFLFKTAPCLELLKPGSTIRIINKIKSKFFLVTFPTQSIGGKKKGMLENYSVLFSETIKLNGWEYQSFTFASELAFLIKKHDEA